MHNSYQCSLFNYFSKSEVGMVICGMHTEIISHDTKCKKKGKKIGACFIRASLVCNAMCVPISTFT